MAWPSPPLRAPCLEKLPEGPGTGERSRIKSWVEAQPGVKVQPGARGQTGIRTEPGGKAQSGISIEIGIEADLE